MGHVISQLLNDQRFIPGNILATPSVFDDAERHGYI